MSYPYLIQPLIIEDEGTDFYDALFEDFVKNGELATPLHAYGYADAIEILASERIIHLVILDLRLPDRSGHLAREGIHYGLQLLDVCANRNRYPIPALLVISAKIGDTDQIDLEKRVSAFAFGRVVVKSFTQLEKPINIALQEIKKYSSLGIHIRDAGEITFPVLSPREEDLLRRCMLKQRKCIGVDLRWWSAELQRQIASHGGSVGWTKTLTGRFLLGDDGRSRPNFFKFDPAADAETVFSAAEIMEHKLAHIKVHSTMVSGDRSLLVTEKVGEVDDDPISLADYLLQPGESITKNLPRIVLNVTAQIHALGDSISERLPLGKMLWRYHNYEVLKREWARNGGNQLLRDLRSDVNPIQLLQELRSRSDEVLFTKQNFLHGDLNVTNIAIDQVENLARSYIFDASGTCASVNVRDLSALEVSVLLHQPSAKGMSLVTYCRHLYDNSSANETSSAAKGPDLAGNVVRLVSEIRAQALQLACPFIYSLMVFDSAMIQLGGLAFGISCNKIANPQDAALLAALTARWLNQILRQEIQANCHNDT